MSFFDLGVNPAIVKTLSKSGINDPFPIQKATLPDAIGGKDVLGRGQTGSGKTLAFGLAAASFFPAIILGIFHKKMNK